MTDLTPTWKQHPLALRGHVEEVPTEWVYQYWGSDVTTNTSYKEQDESSLPWLWERITEEGLKDPLVIRVGIESKTMRLETGNHRIQILREYGVEKVPVTIEIKAHCGPEAANPHTDATKVFPLPPEGILVTSLEQEYMAPSKVFKAGTY